MLHLVSPHFSHSLLAKGQKAVDVQWLWEKHTGPKVVQIGGPLHPFRQGVGTEKGQNGHDGQLPF